MGIPVVLLVRLNPRPEECQIRVETISCETYGEGAAAQHKEKVRTIALLNQTTLKFTLS